MGAIRANAVQRTTYLTTALAVLFASIAALMSLFLSQQASAATLLVTHTAFTSSPQTLDVGQTSGALTLETRNVADQAEVVDMNAALSVTSTSGTGLFSTDGTNWLATGNFVIGGGTSQQSFYYKDTTAGSFTLNTTVTNPDIPAQTWSTTQEITIMPDTTSPTGSLLVDTSHSYGGTVAPTVTANGTCADPNRPYAQCTYAYTLLDQEGTVVATSTQLVAQWQTSISKLSSGNYRVQLIVSDEAGNKTEPMTASIAVDNTAATTISNDDTSYTGGTVQPQLINDSDEVLTFRWVAADDNPDSLTFNETAREPVFRPAVAGTYTFLVKVCDDLGNCTNIPYSFSWKPALAIATTVDDEPPTTSLEVPIVTPVGMVATKFNSTSPEALGIETSTSSAQVSSATAPITASKPAQKTQTTEPVHESAVSISLWWILLTGGIGSACYYAYRNWQLGRPTAL